MGQWTIVIHGTGSHHNFKTEPSEPGTPGNLIPDGKGDFERTAPDADLMASEFVRELKSKGHMITGATFTTGGIEEITKDRHTPKTED